MKNTRDDLSQTVFKRIDQTDVSDHNLDVGMKNVLWAIDGQKSLGTIAKEDRYDLNDLTQKTRELLQLGLIQVARASDTSIDREFVDFLTDQLSYHLGPVSAMIIDEVAKGIGNPILDFPLHNLRRLIDKLAMEIQGEEDTRIFKSKMETEAKRKKYL